MTSCRIWKKDELKNQTCLSGFFEFREDVLAYEKGRTGNAAVFAVEPNEVIVDFEVILMYDIMWLKIFAAV